MGHEALCFRDLVALTRDESSPILTIGTLRTLLTSRRRKPEQSQRAGWPGSYS